MKFLTLFLFLQLYALSLYSAAEIRLPKIIDSGAVLQRDEALTLFGFASESQKVVVFLDNEQVASTQSKDGKWAIGLPPQPAGGPHVLTFKGKNTITLRDIYFGDVWLASGQSNMETTLARVQYHYPDEINTMHNPLIRQFKVPREYDFKTPRDDFSAGSWQMADKKYIEDFSAIGYFFAKHIQASQNVPIGIISMSKGGSAVESWMSESALQGFPKYLEVVQELRQQGYLEALIQQDRSVTQKWFAKLNKKDKGMNKRNPWFDPNYDDSQWVTGLIPGQFATMDRGGKAPENTIGSHWLRRELVLPASVSLKNAQLWLGRVVDADTTYINGQEIGSTSYKYPPRIYDIPDGLLKKGANSIVMRIADLNGGGGLILDKPYVLKLEGLELDLSGEWKYRRGARMERQKSQRFIEYNRPLGFYNAMLAPLANTKIKGVIWYQGESNVGREQEYALLMRALIKDWRGLFGNPELPFLYVQLANFLEQQSEIVDSSWAALREQQRLLASVKNTAMAVALDVGEWNDIHPVRKKPLGDRLALAARKMVYGETDIVASGPRVRCFSAVDNKIVLRFDSVGNGLSSKGVPLRGFIAAGADGRFTRCKASIEDNNVVLEGCALERPLTIRYAWADNPGDGLLYNAEGLPASSFSITNQCAQGLAQ